MGAVDVVSADAWRTWALVAVSLFNTIVLLWLGLTLWLNADRRAWGISLATGGFLLGSIFFVCHSALLLSPTWELTRSNTLWLAGGMVPVLLLPFVWYVVLLWYGGYWTGNDLHRRHREWLAATGVVLVAGFGCLVVLGIPFLPTVSQLTPAILPLRSLIKLPVFGIPLVALGFSLYVVLCVALSLDALRRPSDRPIALRDAARERARPWLAGSTSLLLLVGILVAVAVVWIITNTKEGAYYVLRRDDLAVISGFDLVIAMLIGASMLMLGQAMTGYELFMGRALPRLELGRQWRWAVGLAMGYAVGLGGALVWGLEPVFAALLTALLMTLFFALIGWRSHLQWRTAMRQMRPFLSSPGWYERLTDDSGDSTNSQAAGLLETLCVDLLNAPFAYLLPAPQLASFVAPQTYPPDHAASPLPAPALTARGAAEHGPLAVAVAPAEHGGAAWAVPLWSERGAVGMLLLGPRVDRSLYAEEELEIARAAGERLIDAAAGLALSRRLMQLQREQMAAAQLGDQRTRRVLHDEVLPLIHTALLSLPQESAHGPSAQRLAEAHSQVSALLRDLPATPPDVARFGVVKALQRAIEGEFRGGITSVIWQVDERAAQTAAALPSLKAETLYFAARELVRNAAKHAQREGGATLRITVSEAEGRVEVVVADDGPGVTGDIRAGHGLALHTTLMAIAGGSLVVEQSGEGGTVGRAKI